LNSYIIPAFCIHNTQGLKFMPWAFWQSYLYMRRKWRHQLPIKTSCITVSKSGMPVLKHITQSFYVHCIKGEQPGRRVNDPVGLFAQVCEQPQPCRRTS
jgi:hypothetical protein